MRSPLLLSKTQNFQLRQTSSFHDPCCYEKFNETTWTHAERSKWQSESSALDDIGTRVPRNDSINTRASSKRASLIAVPNCYTIYANNNIATFIHRQKRHSSKIGERSKVRKLAVPEAEDTSHCQ